MSAPPRLFDRDLLRARLDRAAPRYAAADFLKARAAEDAVVRLEAIMRDFPRAVDLGALKGNKGNQQYAIPTSTDLDQDWRVVVWCRAFTVSFTEAPLT